MAEKTAGGGICEMVKTRCQTAAIDTDTTIRTENARRFIAGDWFLQIKPLQASATACACVRKKRRYKRTAKTE